ncbi:MAG: tRNA uracil 4-sulfurtransferase ThiI [Bacillota bacterium]|nr:tRNA uracil 4-sulfurtransferase ThiI [Bacillota bacterium]
MSERLPSSAARSSGPAAAGPVPGARRLLLLRYGEIGLKGKNRPGFERQLRLRVEEALARAGFGDVEVAWRNGRLLVGSPAEEEARAAVERALGRVFGIVSLSPVWGVPPAPEAIEGAALAALEEALAEAASRGRPARTFKVEARRVDKRFPLGSLEMNARLGGFLHRAHPELGVDVHAPDVRVQVEVREREAYAFALTLPGPGGLPLGSSGRAVLLLSGGIDSPVAGWMAMRRGIEIEAVHFESFPYTSEQAREKVLELARILAGWSGEMTVHVVHFTDIQTAIYREAPAELGVILMRRAMFRLAEELARRRGALGTVTGENVGQVASQTLESMGVINRVTTLPVLRPLITMDKSQIIEEARRIGTYETSILPYADCCSLFVPAHPATRPRLAEVEGAEARIDWERLLPEALERTVAVSVRP